MLSILILTKNEEHELPGCLSSLKWCDDIIIYDSYSTDQTSSIALRAGCRLIQRPGQDCSKAFGGDEGFHRTWALRQIPFKYPWVFTLDADERLPADTLDEIIDKLSRDASTSSRSHATRPVAYSVRRRDFLQGRHLKYVQATPWYIRLFRPEHLYYTRLINPVTVVDGEIGTLHSFIDHYPFSKGLSHWISRHNSYSTLEAEHFCSLAGISERPSFLTALFARSFHLRRVHQKQLFMRLPARPIFKFVLLYIIKRGFLDGRPGLTYAFLQSIYEYFIVLKVRELRQLGG